MGPPGESTARVLQVPPVELSATSSTPASKRRGNSGTDHLARGLGRATALAPRAPQPLTGTHCARPRSKPSAHGNSFLPRTVPRGGRVGTDPQDTPPLDLGSL